ncbi:MAG TPA: response regulator transcription factor [Bacteroidota bacterium]|nr:response regulator transcription factor [Bacteroidota bacterium]
MRRITVFLADDHAIVREGIRSSLLHEPSVKVVGEAADGASAVQMVSQLKPNVILLDLSMPGPGGMETIPLLKKKSPTSRILILTIHNSKEYIRRVLQVGADGYILKDATPSELVQAIRAVHRGEAFFSPAVSKVLLEEARTGSKRKVDGSAHFSTREKEVLSLIAQGLTNQQIADKLFVSVTTIRTHRQRIMKKLGIHSAAGLIKYALQREADYQ